VHAELAAVGLDLELLGARFLVLQVADIAERVHAGKNVLLARTRALGIDDRVVGRWRLRQAGQHGRFGDGDVADILAKINLRGR
jgi:hypothetical protein